MSLNALNHVWKHSHAKGSALLLLLAIADYAQDDGGMAFPSIQTLADKARMTPRWVQLLQNKLVEMGELSITPKGSRYGTNEYRIIGVEYKTGHGEEGSQGRTIVHIDGFLL